jgi:hypothetical protein
VTGAAEASELGVVFCNPPYSKATPFISKAVKSWREGECEVVLLLLPARTHQSAFHEAIAGHADIFFLRGRMSFGLPEGGHIEFFGIMLALYGADGPMIERMLAAFDCVHVPKQAAVLASAVGSVVVDGNCSLGRLSEVPCASVHALLETGEEREGLRIGEGQALG